MAGKQQAEKAPFGADLAIVDRLLLAAQTLTAALLTLWLFQGSAPTLPLYLLLGLVLLSLALHMLRLLSPSRRPAPEMDEQICRLLSETADPATAVFQATHVLRERTGVGRVALLVTDGAGRHAELLAEAPSGLGARASWGGRVALERIPALAAAAREQRPFFYPRVSTLGLSPENEHLLAADLPSLYLYPLLAGQSPVGFLALAMPHRRRRPAGLDMAARILALYIRQTGLQPDALRPQDEVELLYEITTSLNADLSLEKVLTNILTQSIAKVGATRGSIFLLDEDGQVSHRILCRENVAPEVSGLVIREIMDQGLASWVAEHKQGTLIEDVLHDERWIVLPDHAGHVRSAIAAPFLHQGRMQGMIFLTHPEVGRFRTAHLQLLNSIANQAAIAIQNARLYEWAENERRTLSAVLDSSADAIVVTDPQGRILLANRAAKSLGIENRPVHFREALLHPDMVSFWERATTGEGTLNDNVRVADGRTLSVSVAPVRDREGRTIGRVAAMHDVTQMVELDEMKSRFVSTVSHDLKAPLTAIRGFAELIPLVGEVNEEQNQFVARIKEVVGQMSRLIGDLLDLGRIEAGLEMEMQALDIRDLLLSGKYDLAMPAQQKKIVIDVEIPAYIPSVKANRFRLQQVVANLLSNAIKYTPTGGHIWLRAEAHPDEVVVSVSDTGIGIPPTDLPHVFEKFYRVQDSRVMDQDGSGLGLAIVKSVISEHGGRVWVQSHLGKGSTFSFSLPVAGKEDSPSGV